MSPNLLGALLMMASMAAFTLNDTMIKLTAGAVPFFQLIFLRSLITCGLILAAGRHLGALTFRIGLRDWTLIWVRAFSEVIIAYFFLSALFNMPLANLTAILGVVPLAVTLASALLFHEPVGWRRFAAIFVGFLGVLIIVRPGADGFNIWSGYALIAMLGVAFRDLLTRRLSPDVPSLTVTLVTAGAVAGCFGIAALSAPWAPVAPTSWALILGSSVAILGGYFFSIRVMRVGDVSFTAPFRYTGLVWALILGWSVFGEWPGWITLAGAVMVVATGIFTFYRERQLLRC